MEIKLKYKKFIAPIVLLAVCSAMFASGATSTFFTVTNSATVVANIGLSGAGPFTSTQTCTASSGTYGPSVSIPWGNIPAGQTSKEFICVQNTGTSTYTIGMTNDLISTVGTLTSPQVGATLAAGAFISVELDLAVLPGAPVGPIPSFTISFQ